MNMPKSRKQDSFLWILTRNCEGTEQLQKENNNNGSNRTYRK